MLHYYIDIGLFNGRKLKNKNRLKHAGEAAGKKIVYYVLIRDILVFYFIVTET